MNSRWLLPFTYGVDMRAIDYLVSLAENNGATLIPVSLVSVPKDSRSGGARLEHIQQSKDFLEAVKYKSARLQVPVERYEVFIWHFHDITEWPKEKSLQERDSSSTLCKASFMLSPTLFFTFFLYCVYRQKRETSISGYVRKESLA